MSEFDMIYEADMEDLSITLELEDGTVLECSVLARFPVDGQQYIALQPEDEEHGEDMYLYRCSEDEHGQPVLGMIETEDEYEAVADRFDEILDEAEYDEIVGDEEDE